MVAAYWGRLEVVKLLLDKGADVNEKLEDSGMTALAYAAGKRHWEVVKLLLDKGAHLDAPRRRWSNGTDDGCRGRKLGNGQTALG